MHIRIVESYVRKGSRLMLSGAIRTRKWTDKHGNNRYTTEIIVAQFGSRMIMIDPKIIDERTNYTNGGGSSSIEKEIDDDVPF